LFEATILIAAGVKLPQLTSAQGSALKEHGFSRAIDPCTRSTALAAEGMQMVEEYNPSGAKALTSFVAQSARLKPCPFKT
jgi:hypothetical protein